jgi:hypothetical protein
MAPATILTGEWATAEDTARELGVPKTDLKKLKDLAALALSRGSKKSAAPKNSALPTGPRNTGIVTRTSQTTKTHHTKSARTATKKARVAKRAKS